MAVTWGTPLKASNGWQVRVGYEELSRTSVTAASTSQGVTYRMVAQSLWALDDYVDISATGDGVGDWSKSQVRLSSMSSNGSWSTAPVVELNRWTETWPLKYGTAQSGTFTLSLSDVVSIPGTARVSGTHSVAARPYNPPNPPSSLTVTRSSDTTHTLKFGAGSVTADRPVSNFEFQRWDMAGNTYVSIGTATSAATSFVDKGTFANSKFSWRIRTKNPAGVSVWVYSPMVRTTPAAPSSFTAKKSGSAIVLTWANQALDPTGFQVVKNTSTGGWDYDNAVDLAAASRTWTDSSPSPSFAAKYAIRAKADSLYSGYVHSNEVQLLTNPSAPSNTTPASTVNVDNDVVFKWTHSSVDTTSQRSFELRYRLAGTSNAWTTKTGTTASTYNAGKMDEGLWEWQVRTWGDYADPSVWSTLQTFRVAAAPVVGIQTPGSVETKSSATVTWSFQDTASTQAEWQAKLFDSSNTLVSSLTGKTASTSVTFPVTIRNGSSYRVEVRAKNAFGLWSNTDTSSFVVQYALPAAPALVGYWDADRSAVSVTVSSGVGGEVETSSMVVYRSENGQPWVMVSSGLSDGEAIIDPIPMLNTTVSYKVVAISSLPSEMESQPLQLLTDATLNSWAMWNFGPGFQQYARAQFDLKPKDSPRAKKVLEQFEGRVYPLEFMDEARTHDYSLSFTLDESSSSKSDFIELAFAPAPVCYRLPSGEKVFVSVQGVDFDESKALSSMEREVAVSMSMERVEYDE